MRRALRVAAALVCAGLVAAACSSSPGSHTTTSTTAHSHKTTTTTSTTSSVPPTTASTTTSAGVTACRLVTATPGQTQGAAGTIVGTITMTPVGSATCTMEGYPVLARFSSSGATVPITIVNGTGADAVDAPGGVTATVLELAHCVSAPVGTSE